jgi:hypothetical protein
MAFSFHASCNIDSVNTGFERLEESEDIHSSRAGHLDDFDERRVIEPHRTCQVRSAVRSKLAAERHNFRLKARRLRILLYRLLCRFHSLLLREF